MAKTAKSAENAAGPSWAVPKTVTHPEHHHTLNHLHHVSSFYATLAAWGSEQNRHKALSAQCERQLSSLARKAVIRLDTSVKRAVCRRCNVPAIAGLTLATRSKPSGPHGHVVQNTCSVCGSVRRTPAPNEVVASQPKTPKLPQRQRRKVGRVVKALLREPCAKPTTSSKPSLSRRQRSLAAKQRSSTASSTPNKPIKPTSADMRLQLPPYSDRIQGSGWDRNLLAQPYRNTPAGTSSLAFLERATRSRGDHVVTRGIGKNGAVGPL